MPKHQIIRRVKMGGGVVVSKVVNISRTKPVHTEIVKTDYTKPIDTPAPVVNAKTKKSVVEEKPESDNRFSQSKNQPTKEIPINIVPVFDESQSKATRAQVLKAINQALIGKPKKLGQRGGFLKRLE